MTKIKPPYTVYFVAAVYIHRTQPKHLLVSEAFVVSGRTPLSAEEAVARAIAAIVSNWAADRGPLADWIPGATNVVNCEVA
jgi:hypothetical protein